ncbi:glycosyltransferase [Leptolyngbya cf. ectocarpi LEGE 11479]|uniref:Glycosyltransferase n=1 Tax=Leptolyngbya cf. ectocarpi LEGE 11479 TaxID=1828722 RepID=A0A928X279_LEPEC|nr:glycosyltransferase [Leptolyngbya ectocarpi]MBE9065703.1 glycosyltransferase [Leptolyngbya cf. ectocarpi LEGE 11479]
MSFPSTDTITTQRVKTLQPVLSTQTVADYPTTKSRKLRVLIVGHTYIVGVNQGKLEAIANAGAEVGLLVPQHWQALQWKKRFTVETPYPQIKVYPVSTWFEGQAGAYVYPPSAIVKTIADFRPDIIQIEEEVFSLTAFEVSLLAWRFKIPVVLFSWENMDRRLSAPRRWLRQFVFNRTRCIISGNHEGADIIKQWGYTKPVEIMPQLGVDLDLFSPRLRQHRSRTDSLRIGFVGRIAHQKGIDTLIETAYLLKQQDHRFHLQICGSGVDVDTFQTLARDYNLEDHVTWRGGVSHDEVPQEIAKMDVLVLPSRTVSTWKEQFGHVLIEAMAMGIPVVGSTCGEIPNVIGKSALVFPEGDAHALTKILARFIQDRDWWQQMSQYSLKRIDQHYSHQRIAERSIGLWRSVLETD